MPTRKRKAVTRKIRVVHPSGKGARIITVRKIALPKRSK